ncbi:TonB-dependent receptor [Mucilaginibacter aquariorum]|uniref:TonB-dependent receptor n=1 Tax=Mucilaginibacter aquariorum TaxID=2967225 RepID=A0ABT1SZR3_9SPHI|nr:TonB-dependent receptor [Mucilaginibacter aquariorum]MCQ6957757.1 TonB-dependent receptor [Mucilaginibacter aquariorum]
MNFFTQTGYKLPAYVHDKTPIVAKSKFFGCNSANKRKIIMRINLTFAFLITMLLQISLAADAQKVTFNKQNASLEDVLKEIRKQTDYNFLYTDEMMKGTKPVDAEFKNASLEDALKQCFAGQPLTYSINQKTVVIRRLPKTTQKVSEVPLPAFIIKGKVTDTLGRPIPGVNVKLNGTTIGTTTDIDGNYSINAPDGNGTLVFSYLGFNTQEVQVNGRNTITIQLKERASALNEVVVVGYGTQKKVNLTGAVSVVSGKDLDTRPVGQTSAALAGVAPGVTVIQNSGRPGGDAGTIRIRGVGTTGNADPLVLIDGIEGTMNNIDANIIESISILKDAASASIYGSRAANGVILITTKRGSGKKISITYNSYAGWQKPTNMPDVVNALDHMLLMNEAYTNVGRTQLYPNDLIEQYRLQNGVSSDKYPNTNWQKEVLTGSGFQQSHFVNINGGSDNIRVLTSVGYFDQKGIIENSGYRRYTVRNNTDITFSKKLSMKFDLQFVNGITKEPAIGTGNVFNQMDGIPANQLAKNSNGTWGIGWNGLNPVAASIDGGTNQTTSPSGIINASLNYRPVDWLTAEFTIAPKLGESIGKNFNKAIQTYYPDGTIGYRSPALTSLTESNSRSIYNNMRATLTANKGFGAHTLKVLLGASEEDYHNDYISAFRDTYVLTNYPVINAGSAVNQQTTGTSEEWALRSFFGRINYDYKQKYLLEVNGRYDGSSRFSKGNKYAFFPSASAGWRISEEKFMEPLKRVVDELKLRASWGRLGNQNIGTYPYVTSVDLGSGTLGNQIVNIAALNDLANSDISWETTEMSDIGIDMTLFSNLTISADYYSRKTKDILLTLNVPLIMGLNAPFQNAGVISNKGWDLAIGYKGNINEFKYGINVNLSDVINKVVDMRGISENKRQVSREGYAYNSIYGLQAEGFFKDAADVAGHAKQFGTVAPGDLKYKDQNNDGLINDNDKVVLGSVIPRYTFGVNFNSSYKGIDLSFLLQGVGKGNSYLYGPGIMPFSVGNLGGTILEPNKDRWTPETPNAKYPRLAFGESNNEQNSSFWMKDASYVRLKNVQIGYTFPASISGLAGIKKLRVYVNGSNLFTLDRFWDGFDVESPVGTVSVYPQVKVYSFGLSANF